MHHRRLRAEEDPVVTYSAAEAQDWIQRAEAAITEFFSVDPKQRRAFALELLPVHLSSNSHHRRGGGHAVRSTRFRPLSLWRRSGVARPQAQDDDFAFPAGVQYPLGHVHGKLAHRLDFGAGLAVVQDEPEIGRPAVEPRPARTPGRSPCRSKYAARRASSWLRKVTPPYSVMPRGDGVHL